MKTSIDNNQIDVDEYASNVFYTASHICSRGRKYQPATIGHQSGHDGKMATMFVASDASSASAQKAIKVNIARHFWDVDGNDIDKMSIDAAIAVFEANKDVMATIVDDYAGFIRRQDGKVTKTQIQAFHKVAVDGFNAINNGAKSSMIIPFDGSCSGIQFASAITRDAEMAASVNIAASVNRNDIYIRVVDIAIAAANAGDYSDDVMAIINDPAVFNRKAVKKAVMTQAYGSGFYAIMQDAFANFKGADSDAIVTIAYIVEAARNSVTGGAVRMMEMFNRINKAVNGVSTYTHRDGFVYSNAKAKYTDGYIVAGRNNDKKGQAAIAPDMIHSFDAAHIRSVVNNCDFDIVTIHDSFGCAPKHAEEMNRVIREQFVKMFDGDRNVIKEFFDENKDKMTSADASAIAIEVDAFEFGSFDIASVMDNEFAWS